LPAISTVTDIGVNEVRVRVPDEVQSNTVLALGLTVSGQISPRAAMMSPPTPQREAIGTKHALQREAG
jgi:hypothetical protein